MASKASIWNLALDALLLHKRITNADTDTGNEANVLRTHWQTAYDSALVDMNLASTSSQVTLSLITQDPNLLWSYAYAYPTNCVFFQRIQSTVVVDSVGTHIPKQIKMHNGQKVIFTNEEDAIGEFIANDIPLASLSASAALTIAYRLAVLAAPLVTGKGARKLREDNLILYATSRAEAQEKDRSESFSFVNDATESEFVAARLSSWP